MFNLVSVVWSISLYLSVNSDNFDLFSQREKDQLVIFQHVQVYFGCFCFNYHTLFKAIVTW